jgi:thiol-disulfide isomerase/thioredoxin
MRNLITVVLSLFGAAAALILPQQLRPPALVLSEQPTVAPLSASVTNAAPYPNWGAAPEIENDVWLNTEDNAPLRLADLRGQVVLLEFWTFGCINCQHVLPYVRRWHDRYHEQGLQVIGIHFPEFSYEADYNNLVAALARLDVPYPVAQDNDGLTWDAYGQRYWPTLYLIDKRGNLRYQRIGEGGYEQTEAAIRALLAENA